MGVPLCLPGEYRASHPSPFVQPSDRTSQYKHGSPCLIPTHVGDEDHASGPDHIKVRLDIAISTERSSQPIGVCFILRNSVAAATLIENIQPHSGQRGFDMAFRVGCVLRSKDDLDLLFDVSVGLHSQILIRSCHVRGHDSLSPSRKWLGYEVLSKLLALMTASRKVGSDDSRGPLMLL